MSDPGPARRPPPTGRDLHDTSVLFLRPEDRVAAEECSPPACFGDLNLDQVMAAVTAGRDEYDLAAFYSSPLADEDAVRFRQEVFIDLEPKGVREAIGAFAGAMRSVRGLLRQNLTYKYQQESWFFEAAETYGRGVSGLVASFESIEVRSRGLRRIKEYLTGYVGSAAFQSFVAESTRIREALTGVRYNLHIRGGRVTVSPPDPAPDYTAQIHAVFGRFRRGAVRDYLATFSGDPDLNHVGILDRIALLYPDTFGALDEFCDRHQEFVDPTIAAFDREVQFYLAYLEFIDRLRPAGLAFCSPRVTEGTKETCARETFDIALASKLIAQGSPVVRNDFRLKGAQRLIVVTGPNQGGKTTFARAFGQLHYLASLGCPVPGEEAELPLTDAVFTHFGREEQLADRRGRLEDDLLRMRAVLDAATPRSILILNEVFTSTTLLDAVFLSTEVLHRIEALDLLGVWVTFVDELASMSERTVSMVSNVLPEDPTVRTFKITRRPADGHAYAAAIAAKYGVSYARLKARLPA
jgi:DNA mismatch repair protein MutS